MQTLQTGFLYQHGNNMLPFTEIRSWHTPQSWRHHVYIVPFLLAPSLAHVKLLLISLPPGSIFICIFLNINILLTVTTPPNSTIADVSWLLGKLIPLRASSPAVLECITRIILWEMRLLEEGMASSQGNCRCYTGNRSYATLQVLLLSFL